jgi:hypothetical protein
LPSDGETGIHGAISIRFSSGVGSGENNAELAEEWTRHAFSVAGYKKADEYASKAASDLTLSLYRTTTPPHRR